MKILKFFDTDPGWKKFGSGILDGKIWILDLGWKKFGSGINIPDPQHWVLVSILLFLVYKVNGQHREIFVLADFCYSLSFRGRERRNYFEWPVKILVS